jgi:hypothetical protein
MDTTTTFFECCICGNVGTADDFIHTTGNSECPYCNARHPKLVSITRDRWLLANVAAILRRDSDWDSSTISDIACLLEENGHRISNRQEERAEVAP